jgi:pyruvate dehydrogenase kinase 2/3/4
MYDSQQFLDRFYMSRIGIRVLAGQYLALRERPLPNYVGMICQTTSPSDIVRKAARDAMGICRRKYGRSPAVNLTGRLDLTFPYIPTYLHYILLELLKNALRATAEHHLQLGQKGSGSNKQHHSSIVGSNSKPTPLPPVTVIIADGDDNEDVVVKIADKGGGIPRSRMEKIWSYLYTTADPALQQAIFYGRDHSNVSPIAGLGYGLPISRSYCRYFGGDIDIMSMDG